MGDFIDHALIGSTLTVSPGGTLSANENTNLGFRSEMEKDAVVLVTAGGYENLRMEFAVNVLDLVRSCLLTHRACQRRGFHTQLVPSNRPANASLFTRSDKVIKSLALIPTDTPLAFNPPLGFRPQLIIPMDCPSAPLHFDYPHRSQRPPFATQLSQSPVLEYPPSPYSGHEAKFDVQVSRVNYLLSFTSEHAPRRAN